MKISIVRSVWLLFFLLFLIEKNNAQMDGMTMMAATTKAQRPLTVPSNESTKKQLAFARAEGDSVDNCTSYIKTQAGNTGGQMRAGEYKLTYAVAAPEGWYAYNNNALHWQQPEATANAHFWLFVQDGADGRIVPPLDVTLTVRTGAGKLIEEKRLPFAWMPLVNGYGNNVMLPDAGDYKFVITITPPLYHRHDPYNGDRFTQVTTAVIPVMVSSLSQLPLLSKNMEAQQGLATKAGEAYSNTLQAMYKQANDGRDTTSGDYFMAYAIEYSEGYWYEKNDKLIYKTDNELSSQTNGHVEVSVRDAKTGRFLHNLNVTASLYGPKGGKIGSKTEMFMWHPWLYHYGENWRVPKGGNYQLKVHIEPPAYRRYGQTLGNQFAQPLNITFNNITIKAGQK